MKIGDLVKHNIITKATGGFGVIMKTPEETNNGDYLVYFSSSKLIPSIFCSPRTLKLVDNQKNIN
tara:strand:- start:1277 stop:1471 length:195 start_codon:yes stop_codon:yes gene_type:complete